jgi:hypothetical protein
MITATSKRSTKVQGVYSGSQERPSQLIERQLWRTENQALLSGTAHDSRRPGPRGALHLPIDSLDGVEFWHLTSASPRCTSAPCIRIAFLREFCDHNPNSVPIKSAERESCFFPDDSAKNVILRPMLHSLSSIRLIVRQPMKLPVAADVFSGFSTSPDNP